MVTSQHVADAVNKQKPCKAVGSDSISSDAHTGFRLCIHLTLLFNLFIKFSYPPKSFMHIIIVPLVKCKSGNLCDVNNYRAIAISCAVSKFFEYAVISVFHLHSESEKYQFGFKPGHSTGLCTSVLKRTVDYFTGRESHVFACFIDYAKAFDRVNYWKLFAGRSQDLLSGGGGVIEPKFSDINFAKGWDENFWTCF